MSAVKTWASSLEKMSYQLADRNSSLKQMSKESKAALPTPTRWLSQSRVAKHDPQNFAWRRGLT